MNTPARLSGVMILCLAAGFVGGWSVRALRGSAETLRPRTIAEIDPASALRSSSEEKASSASSVAPLGGPGAEAEVGVIDRSPGAVDPGEGVEGEDLSHEVVMWLSPDMSEAGPFRNSMRSRLLVSVMRDVMLAGPTLMPL